VFPDLILEAFRERGQGVAVPLLEEVAGEGAAGVEALVGENSDLVHQVRVAGMAAWTSHTCRAAAAELTTTQSIQAEQTLSRLTYCRLQLAVKCSGSSDGGRAEQLPPATRPSQAFVTCGPLRGASHRRNQVRG
jgi:hypothetical protein